MKTIILKDGLEIAAKLIQNGGLVAVPTETVYGLAGNGLDAEAVGKIYEVKGRPAVKPLALMVPDAAEMSRYCEDIPAQARYLAESFWPGPLSIVLKAKDIVPDIVRAGGSTVSLRCPDHPLTIELLRLSGVPFAAPSANPSGKPSPKNAHTVTDYFDGLIDAVVDGGECGLGRESTIIDMSRTPYSILRQGALPAEEIGSALVEKMTVIGITGGTGCGKTTALEELSKLGVPVIDCDALYHKMLSEGGAMLDEIRSRFPEVFINGNFSRKALGAVVFSDKAALSDLNRITHRHITAEVERLLRAHALSGVAFAAIDAIALTESGLSSRCDLTVGVIADRNKRAERIMQRDGISREYAESRISSQKSDEYYIINCDHILMNDGTEPEFREKCGILFKEVLK